MIFQLSSRVPALIEQSHLERKEGVSPIAIGLLLLLTSYKLGQLTGPQYSAPLALNVSIPAVKSGTKPSLGSSVHCSPPNSPP